jgi:hypothetical protein
MQTKQSLRSFTYFFHGPLLLGVFIWTASGSAQVSTWKESRVQHFGLFQSLHQSQGLVTDQKGNVWYSSNYTLTRCQTWTQCTRGSNDDAIPQDIKALGGDHIGDIDYANGFIYAPIEDGDGFKRPFVGIYQSEDLQFVKSIALSSQWQPDGVPWIAVDAANQTLVTSQYERVNSINFYELSSGRPLRQLSLSTELNSVQGGKVWKNHLYLTANNANEGFAVYDVDLSSGNVQKLFKINGELSEVEGLALVANSADKSVNEFYILGLTGKKMGRRTVVYQWKREG